MRNFGPHSWDYAFGDGSCCGDNLSSWWSSWRLASTCRAPWLNARGNLIQGAARDVSVQTATGRTAIRPFAHRVHRAPAHRSQPLLRPVQITRDVTEPSPTLRRAGRMAGATTLKRQCPPNPSRCAVAVSMRRIAGSPSGSTPLAEPSRHLGTVAGAVGRVPIAPRLRQMLYGRAAVMATATAGQRSGHARGVATVVLSILAAA